MLVSCQMTAKIIIYSSVHCIPLVWDWDTARCLPIRNMYDSADACNYLNKTAFQHNIVTFLFVDETSDTFCNSFSHVFIMD